MKMNIISTDTFCFTRKNLERKNVKIRLCVKLCMSLIDAMQQFEMINEKKPFKQVKKYFLKTFF